jgi:hypothetical protein
MSQDPSGVEVAKHRVVILTKEGLMPGDPSVIETKRMLEESGCEVGFQDEAEYIAQGRVEDCDCQMLQCVCVEVRKHKPECRWRKALVAPIGFACEQHNLEECPTCDACTCGV